MKKLLCLSVICLAGLTGCKTIEVRRYDLPALPVRPVLEQPKTVEDVYSSFYDLSVYTLELEAWAETVSRLTGSPKESGDADCRL